MLPGDATPAPTLPLDNGALKYFPEYRNILRTRLRERYNGKGYSWVCRLLGPSWVVWRPSGTPLGDSGALSGSSGAPSAGLRVGWKAPCGGGRGVELLDPRAASRSQAARLCGALRTDSVDRGSRRCSAVARRAACLHARLVVPRALRGGAGAGPSDPKDFNQKLQRHVFRHVRPPQDMILGE